MGRPGLAPGQYFRLLLVGYFEGINSKRGIGGRIQMLSFAPLPQIVTPRAFW
jgi:hypothetical protein